MFSIGLCHHPGCRNQALSNLDNQGNLVNGGEFCLEHLPNKEESLDRIYSYIRQHDKIIGLSLPGLKFENFDLTNKKFYGCNMQYCHFINIHSEFCRMRMNMMDFSVFADCNLLNSNMQFTSFAGSTFSHILFTNSDLVHNNFNGILAQQSSFDDSDLYNSRFINARLFDTSIRNCNIKQTCFNDASFKNVSFKQSNTREAKFSEGVEF
ncbi:MAG: pentapeptide repeat-containing protein [Treponemataceae bacterium]|nr:pentapeptide repeat-containing protein [Treponemataceae bacterium]